MADTTILGESVDIVQTNGGAWGAGSWSVISWSAVIAGALTALAVSIIVIALGSGIGLSLASPFTSSPSAGTLTVMGAVWLVLAQGIGFATGGYLAGRMRRDPVLVQNGETKFRDGANGLLVWAIGVVVSSLILVAAANKVGNAVADTAVTGTAAAGVAAGQSRPIDYFTDTLLRTNPATPANGAPAPANASGNNNDTRVQVERILSTALPSANLSNDDRTYLAQIVSARTGVSEDDAQKRVDDVVNQARIKIAQTADTARKAAEYLSFWTFMSLLFGAVCATLGGILGGDLRDEFATYRATPTAPR